MAHGGGGGGSKKKRGLLQTCLTSTIAIIVFIYVVVLFGSALLTTFFRGDNPPLISLGSAPANQPATTGSNQAAAAPAPTVAPTTAPSKVTVPVQTGSSSAGGNGTTVLASAGGAPAMGSVQVSADGPYYIVEQADLVQNGALLSTTDSLQLIADKLLTTVSDLKAVNGILNDPNVTLVPGEVLRVPSTITQPSPNNGGGNLPATGQYASP
jgi:LysM repeat protein